MQKKRGQIGIEYLMIIGFAVLIIMGILVLAFNYMEILRDSIIMTDASNFADKVISSSEKIFYEGEPSKATIRVYIPQQVLEVQIIENSLFLTIETSSGISKRAYPSNVPIQGQINSTGTVIKLEILASENSVTINEI